MMKFVCDALLGGTTFDSWAGLNVTSGVDGADRWAWMPSAQDLAS